MDAIIRSIQVRVACGQDLKQIHDDLVPGVSEEDFFLAYVAVSLMGTF